MVVARTTTKRMNLGENRDKFTKAFAHEAIYISTRDCNPLLTRAKVNADGTSCVTLANKVKL
jgi:hypothetical protein